MSYVNGLISQRTTTQPHIAERNIFVDINTNQEWEDEIALIKDTVVARIKSETVLAKTGKGWPVWYQILDDFAAPTKGYTASARYLRDEHNVRAWWSNSIVTRYEYVRGLRDGSPKRKTRTEQLTAHRRISEEAVLSKTGKGWAAWFAILDESNALGKGYTTSAKYLREEYHLSLWWAQAVTIRYEW
ncbi:MAG: hypothetical protein GFH27_549279n282 [Chloroflexi bacterium AL-W]|nr:hypothetical protein [Chloroflexi bacterium AL-N1]NOK65248.1 hypothetical protein [Chloroflexi bacterium AL-N10]NOK72487.1 hypothetical protein [Chloroflexi bacterium AL-N5]NOK79427.1 hypothetical protein [Chloroflexi bacterium AL-W]NOK87343.1 hypothetical protein [Chloroflexi bacterium AL-N15]